MTQDKLLEICKYYHLLYPALHDKTGDFSDGNPVHDLFGPTSLSNHTASPSTEAGDMESRINNPDILDALAEVDCWYREEEGNHEEEESGDGDREKSPILGEAGQGSATNAKKVLTKVKADDNSYEKRKDTAAAIGDNLRKSLFDLAEKDAKSRMDLEIFKADKERLAQERADKIQSQRWEKEDSRFLAELRVKEALSQSEAAVRSAEQRKLEADAEARRKQTEREEEIWKVEDAKRKRDEEDAEQNSRASKIKLIGERTVQLLDTWKRYNVLGKSYDDAERQAYIEIAGHERPF